MRFSELLKIERMKYRRSKNHPIDFYCPDSGSQLGIANLSTYFTPGIHQHGLPCLFRALCSTPTTCSHSACDHLSASWLRVRNQSQRAAQNDVTSCQPPGLVTGQILHIDFLFVSPSFVLAVFVIAGYIAVSTFDITEALPISTFWRRRIISNHAPKPGCYVNADSFVRKTLFSVGLNLLLVIPGLLAGASQYGFLPYCYSGYLVSLSACIHHRALQVPPYSFSLYPAPAY